MKVIREIKEILLCIGKRKELVMKKRAESKCWCSKTGMTLNAKHNVSCCRKVSGCRKVRGENNARHDTVLIRRGLVSHEQKWEDRKT